MGILYFSFFLPIREKKKSETSSPLKYNYRRKSSLVVYTNYKRNYFEKLGEYKRGKSIC